MADVSRVCEVLADLVAFNSVSSRSNRDITDYISAHFAALGARIDRWCPQEGKHNLLATIGPQVDGGVMLAGHTDVVPVDDQTWSLDPFELTQRDGKLFGRGTTDMKGFLAVIMVAAEAHTKLDLAKPVHYAFTCDEETTASGAKRLVKDLAPLPFQPTAAIVGEPTSLTIVDSHKGACEYRAEFTGRSGHGARPELGRNAVHDAIDFSGKLLSLQDDLKTRGDASTGFAPAWTTLQIGQIHGGSASNIIPDRCWLDWELRPITQEDFTYVKSRLKKLAGSGRDLRTTVELPPLTGAIANRAAEILTGLGVPAERKTISFWTEAGIYEAAGISSIVCGPGDIAQAHIADEYLEITQLERALAIFSKLSSRQY